MKQIDAFTDGGCIGNPGPGGYGVILRYGTREREFSQGFRRTTNNRMEILAAVVALQALKEPCTVRLHSDSEYLVKMMKAGWPQKWKSNGWRRGKGERALNPDLWEQLLQLCEHHHVEFVWVRGHAGHPQNERCDRLATAAARASGLAVDEEYERSNGKRYRQAGLN